MKTQIDKKIVIDLGRQILDRFGDESFIIYLKISGSKLKDYADYISKYRAGYILELWKNRKHITRLCKLKGEL